MAGAAKTGGQAAVQDYMKSGAAAPAAAGGTGSGAAAPAAGGDADSAPPSDKDTTE